ncbi:hypothetical protein [Geothermobacter hydrogeniphilus]|uniref:Uncharacterized protein n=1 Tax=Geothermobacter hydrogeniphilus TaxID=1969733 RepID=A0A1X0XZP7_9BACT|nr:hypothetical protein [Geothermobacter hydrogeniphilus]ORJ58312.1 hypothetical protein B5V00_12710 [Geothermobacter hydrogeniphilus]
MAPSAAILVWGPGALQTLLPTTGDFYLCRTSAELMLRLKQQEWQLVLLAGVEEATTAALSRAIRAVRPQLRIIELRPTATSAQRPKLPALNRNRLFHAPLKKSPV